MVLDYFKIDYFLRSNSTLDHDAMTSGGGENNVKAQSHQKTAVWSSSMASWWTTVAAALTAIVLASQEHARN